MRVTLMHVQGRPSPVRYPGKLRLEDIADYCVAGLTAGYALLHFPTTLRHVQREPDE